MQGGHKVFSLSSQAKTRFNSTFTSKSLQKQFPSRKTAARLCLETTGVKQSIQPIQSTSPEGFYLRNEHTTITQGGGEPACWKITPGCS